MSQVRRFALAAALALLAVAGGCRAKDPGTKIDLDKAMTRHDALVKAGRTDEAAKALDEIAGEGERLLRLGSVDEAKAVLEWVLKRNPKKPTALGDLGVVARMRGDNETAISYFKRAREVDPLSPSYYYNLALIYYGRKDYDACETQLQQAMKLGLKAQYRLLFALCAEGRKAPPQVVRDRLRAAVDAAESQAGLVETSELLPDGSLERTWKETARRLGALGDDYGYERLGKLVSISPRPEARDFAKRLLAERGNP